jgi:hypothetical protein
MCTMSALHLLAENNFGDTRSGGLAGPMGLLIIVLMAIATVFLIRNMTARIKRLPAEFPNTEAARTDTHSDEPSRGTAAGSTGGDEQVDQESPDGESSAAR